MIYRIKRSRQIQQEKNDRHDNARMTSLWTLVSAVSVVLWCVLYADWHISLRFSWLTWVLTWLATDFSIALDTNLRLDMGLQFLNSSWSREYFFKLGFRTATFRQEGTTHSFNDKLTILVITGSSIWRQRFKTEAGNGSNSHDLEAKSS